MARQDRATRTRRKIVEAAALVFKERGYQGATVAEILKVSGVTKGALYFHFQSKEHLAEGVLSEQDLQVAVPPRDCKTQEMIDVVCLQAYHLQTDQLVRASVRLTMDQQAEGLDRSGPFQRWSGLALELLIQAQEQGELLSHVNPVETADLYVGAFAGIQSMSQAISDYADLNLRVSALQRHILPSIVNPSLLAALDFGPDRGARIAAEIEAADAPVTDSAAPSAQA